MQKAIVWVAVVVVALSAGRAAADNELTPEEKAAGWQLLFNGQATPGGAAITAS